MKLKLEAKHGYGRIVKYMGVFGSVQVLNIVVGLVRNKFVALLIGPLGMGLNALFNSVVSFVSMATNLGISFSAVKHVSEIEAGKDGETTEHFIAVIRAWAFVTGLIGMAACLAAAPLLSRHAFSGGEHTHHFMLLAPAVGLTAVTGGETAVLKGVKRLRQLAMIQIVTIAASLFITVPVYWLFGIAGIVPVIVLTTLASMIATVFYSYRLFPPRLTGMKKLLGEGKDMVRLGAAYTMSGIAACGAEVLIRSFLNVEAGTETLGLYNAGFTITVTYAGLVFTAMDTEYYPRLSSLNHDARAFSLAANRQTEVSLMLISPLLTLMMVILPQLIPLLYSGEFTAVVPMARIALLAMFFNAMKLPAAYMTLAKGDSMAFFLLETTYAAAFAMLTIAGYNLWGLEGTGVALLVAHIFDLLLIYAYTYIRYHHHVSGSVLAILAVQLPLGIAAYALAFVPGEGFYWLGGILLTAVSAAISIKRMVRK